MTEDEGIDVIKSRKYYQGQLNGIDYHSQYAPTFKVRGEKNDTKWMDLNKISAEVIVRKLIEEFKLEIK